MTIDELKAIKNWAVVMRPNSPGDTFRLLHGIRTMFGDKDRVGLLCCPKSFQNSSGLWSDKQSNETTIGNDALVREEGNLVWICLKSLQTPKSGEHLPRRILKAWNKHLPDHPFIFNELSQPQTSVLWTVYSNARGTRKAEAISRDKLLEKTGVIMRRIDGFDVNPPFHANTVFQLPFPILPPPCGKVLKVAMVLRQTGIEEWRYSPCYHKWESWLTRNGVEVTYFGSKDKSDYPKHVQEREAYSLYSKFDTFKKQIENAMEFDIAVGVNSSALDVFAAAGRLVLREAVYQGIEQTKNGSTKETNKSGGWKFNQFLGIAPNVELQVSKKFNRDWCDEDRLDTAFEMVLNYVRSKNGFPQCKGAPMHQGFQASTNEALEIANWLGGL